jgi:hypothetical protein
VLSSGDINRLMMTMMIFPVEVSEASQIFRDPTFYQNDLAIRNNANGTGTKRFVI